MAQNRVIGRGRFYFDKFDANGDKTGERYIGNTPSLSMTGTYQNLDHYDADEGVREKDESFVLQIDRTGTFSCDNIDMANVAMTFGNADPVDEIVLADTGLSETFVAALGRYYQLGSAVSPDGIGNLLNVVVTDNSGLHAYGLVTFTANPSPADTITVNGEVMTFVAAAPATHEIEIGGTVVITAQNFLAEINLYPGLYDVGASGIENAITLRAIASGTGGNSITLAKSGTNPTLSGATLSGGSASGVIVAAGNYEIDLVRGRLHVLDAPADISAGDTIEVQYDTGGVTRTVVIDDNTQVEGAGRFIANNPKGENTDYYWPRIKITPNGEYALKGDTWQTMTFNFEILKPTDGVTNRVYARRQAA